MVEDADKLLVAKNDGPGVSGEFQINATPTTTTTSASLDVRIGTSDSLTIGTFPNNKPSSTWCRTGP